MCWRRFANYQATNRQWVYTVVKGSMARLAIDPFGVVLGCPWKQESQLRLFAQMTRIIHTSIIYICIYVYMYVYIYLFSVSVGPCLNWFTVDSVKVKNRFPDHTNENRLFTHCEPGFWLPHYLTPKASVFSKTI